MSGIITIEICKAQTEDALATLIREAVNYWTSKQKGYRLISDSVGPDVLLVRENASLTPSGYLPGQKITPWQDGVVLVFERVEAAPAAGVEAKKGKSGGG